MQDFEAGFIQNLLGNVLSIQDILGKVNEAIAEDDNEAIVYQFGRLLRRIGDFEPMKSATLDSGEDKQNSSQWMAKHKERASKMEGFEDPFRDGPFAQPTVQEMREFHDKLLFANGESWL